MPAELSDDREAEYAREVGRQAGDYILRALELLREVADGDIFDSLLTLAIVQVNLGQMAPGGHAPYGATAYSPPDSLRRPASVMAVATTLGMPYETVRRKIRDLVQRGVCQRVRGGVIIPQRVLATPRQAAALAANLANMRRLYRGLRAAGVPLD